MPSSHLILCCPLLLLPPIPPGIRVFSNESTLHLRWPKYWSFSFSIIPSKEHPGLISFRMDWLDLLAVQRTLKSLHFMANRWGNTGNSGRLYFWGAPKSLQMVVTAMKLKYRLLLGRKVMTNLDSILKNRDITLPTKIRLVKAMVFPVVVYGCESWTIKKAEHQRNDAFELWC